MHKIFDYVILFMVMMMKVVGNIFRTILFAYLVICAFATFCLLKTNDKGVVQLGNTSLVVMENDVLDYYKKGDLVIVKYPSLNSVNKGDPVLFYDTSFNKNTVTLATITDNKYINENEHTFSYKNAENEDKAFSSEYLIGKVNGSNKMAFVGSVLKTMTSRWGFLFLVILPFLIVFMVEIYIIVKEFKKTLKEVREE